MENVSGQDFTCRQAHRFGPPAPHDWQVPCSHKWMICVHRYLSSVGWGCKETDPAALVKTHQEQAPAARRNKDWWWRARVQNWSLALFTIREIMKPTLDFWRRSSFVTSPVESRWGQASCSAIITFYSRGPLRNNKEWWGNDVIKLQLYSICKQIETRRQQGKPTSDPPPRYVKGGE